MSTKSKRRYKKNKESEKQEDKEKQNKRLEQIKLVKEYLNLDLSESSAATQLKYKSYIDNLTQSLELKKDENNKEKLLNILYEINSKLLDYKNEIIQNKYDLIPLEKEKETAKDIFEQKLKKYQDKDKFQKMLVDKGNGINLEKDKIYKEGEAEKNRIIKEAEDYIKNLQQKTIDSMPERQKLIDENSKLRENIQKCLEEGLKMKEDFDKQMKINEIDFKKFENLGKDGIQKTMDSLKEKTQNSILANTNLKTELMTYQNKNQEMENMVQMANREYEKLLKEIDNSSNDSFLMASQNEEIRRRLAKNKINKEELALFLSEYEKQIKKIDIMISLNKKYNQQFQELDDELHPKPKKNIQHQHCGCGHDHDEDEEHDEHDEHQHEHQHDDHEHDHCGCGHEH
jgi:hypothetical protein